MERLFKDFGEQVAESMTLTPYHFGSTPFFACKADPRFSYCLHVPDEAQRILVYVHGTYRDAALYRDHLVDFAERHCCLILAPLFPAGIIDINDVDNYKQLLYRGIRFDEMLLHMVTEVRERYRIPHERIILGGFSGGAQFAHRFLYLHPGCLQAVSIAAPGRVTLLNEVLDWWPGIHNVNTLFGVQIDYSRLREVSAHLAVGSEDSADLSISEDSHYWAPGANLAGTTRLERLKSLYADFQQHGMRVKLDVINGVGHDGLALLDASIVFFQKIIEDSV